MGQSGSGGASGFWEKNNSYGGALFSLLVSGDVAVPSARLTDKTILEAVNDALAINPYTNCIAYDPDGDLDDFREGVEDLMDAVEDFDPMADFEAALTLAKNTLDTLGLNDDQAMLNFEAVAEAAETGPLEADYASLLSGFNDMGSAMGSQCLQKMLNALDDTKRRRAERLMQLKLFSLRDRSGVVVALAQTYMNQKSKQLDALHVSAGVRQALAHMTILAKQDQLNTDIEMATKKLTWEPEILQHGMSALATVVGAGMMPRTQTQKERLLGAAMTSISAGAQIASVMGPAAGIIGGVADLTLQLIGMSK